MCSPGLAKGRPRLAGPYRSRDRRGAPNGSVGATVGARLLARARARSAFCHASFTVGRRLRAVALSGPARPLASVSVGKRSAQRPKGAKATGIVTRRAKTAKRASWSRAGRSRARRNRARRPVRRTGRAPLPSDRRSGRYRALIQFGWRRLRCPKRRGAAAHGSMRALGGGVGCEDRKRENGRSCRWRRAKRGGDMPSAGRRAVALRMEERWPTRKDRRAVGDGALAPSRPRGRGGAAWREGVAGSASGAGAKRRAAMRDTWHGAKKGPIPRRSAGPARGGGRRAALSRRRDGPGCRAAGPCRPGSR